MQDALNSIMELCESNMNENDYLIVTGQLKRIYDENKKKHKSANKVINADRILNTDELQIIGPNVIFRLSEHEQKLIMDSRIAQYYEEIDLTIRQEIDSISLQLRETTEEKRDAWAYLKEWRNSFSANRVNSLYEHRELVQKEKELKARLKQLKSELIMIHNPKYM